jgi:methylamine dehydrogenase accessory protein MauD
MSEALVAANVVLWIVVVALACVVAALARQVGVLSERVLPAGALMLGRGPAVGDAAPVVRAVDLAGNPRDVGGPHPAGRATLVFFASPTCPVCKTLLPVVRAIARAERGWLDVVVASDGAVDEHAAFARRERLGELPYVLSAPLAVTYQVGKLPYAVLVDGAGILRAKGLVNSREHLESLFEAMERRIASIQDWVAGQDAPEEGAHA